MASKLPAVKNAAYIFRCVLFAQSDNQIKSNPTIATGDWKVSIDGGTFANLATLPDVDPDSTVQVKVSLSADEMNGDEIMVTAIDASGAEWHSAAWSIHTAAQTFDTMDANIDAALADTNELQTDWANGGRLDVILDARASQTSVDDVPTNAELATALGTADDAVLAAIAALNNLSSAGAQAAAAAALTAYGAATAAALAVVDGIADKLDTAMELDGAVYRFTTNALEQGPGGGSGATAAELWAYATRTLTATTVAGPGTELDGSDITAYRGDSFSVSFADMGSVAARTKLWFTAKARASQDDDDAMIQISEAGGLLYINGAAAGTSANGSLTVTDANAGDATLVLAAAETAKMPGDRTLVYDVQMLTASGVLTLAVGTITFTADVTRATS